MEEEEYEEDDLKRYSEYMKDEDTTMQSVFLTKPAEERKDEETKMQSIFLTKPIEERKDKYTMKKSKHLKNSAYVQAEDREGSIRTSRFREIFDESCRG